MKLQKQYGDFSSYPYPLSPADQAFVSRIAKQFIEKAVSRALAIHSLETPRCQPVPISN